MPHETEVDALADARQRWSASGYRDTAARQDMEKAERRLAAARGESWAEEIELPALWDTGAPMPHVISNGARTDLICYAADPNSHWDETYARSASLWDAEPKPLLQLTFHSCQSIKFGGPSDETLSGHPLWGRGLVFYGAHVVHNSTWLTEEDRIQSVHPGYQAGGLSRDRTHYLLAFHDETFEALAKLLEVRTGTGVLTSWIHDAVSASFDS